MSTASSAGCRSMRQWKWSRSPNSAAFSAISNGSSSNGRPAAISRSTSDRLSSGEAGGRETLTSIDYIAVDGVELPLPIQRKPLQQIIQLQLRGLPPVEDGLHNIRREQRHPQHPAHVGRHHALCPGQVLELRVHAGIEHLPPPERPP